MKGPKYYKDIFDDLVNWHQLIYYLALAPILFIPVVFFASIFVFDDPGDEHLKQEIIFYMMNSYWIVILILVCWSLHIYKKTGKLLKSLFPLFPLFAIYLFIIGLSIWLIAPLFFGYE